MNQDSFADRIGSITVLEGIVRIDFVTATGERDERGHPRFVRSHRVIMGAEGFERSFQTLLDARRRLAGEGKTETGDE